jgi:hypothetical protein
LITTNAAAATSTADAGTAPNIQPIASSAVART